MRHAADVGYSLGLKVVDHPSLSKQIEALNEPDTSGNHWQSEYGMTKIKIAKAFLSVDSTTINAGKTWLLWVLYNEERVGIKLRFSFKNDIGMPLQVVERLA